MTILNLVSRTADGAGASSDSANLLSRFSEHATDCLAGVTSGFTPGEVPPRYGNAQTHAMCKALGAGAGLVADGALIATGSSLVGGGTVVSGTGVGAVAGVPTAAAGVAIAGAGVVGGAMHAEKMGEAMTTMMRGHTKNKRPSNWNKHTKPRPGRGGTKQRGHDNWVQNPNKRK